MIQLQTLKCFPVFETSSLKTQQHETIVTKWHIIFEKGYVHVRGYT